MASRERFWFWEFVVKDWLSDPCVTRLKDGSRAIWFDALCHMFLLDRCGQLSGSIDDLARLCRTISSSMLDAVQDIKTCNAGDVTERHGIVTLENRRMRRDWMSRKSATERQLRKRRRSCHDDVTPDVTPPLKTHPQTQRKEKYAGEPAGFLAFWLAWPQHSRKVNRKACLKHWLANSLEENTDQIVAAVRRFKSSRDWTKGDGQYIPLPLSWLRSEAWEGAQFATPDTSDVPFADIRKSPEEAERIASEVEAELDGH